MGAILFFPTESLYHWDSDFTVWTLSNSSKSACGQVPSLCTGVCFDRQPSARWDFASLNIQTGTCLENDTCFWHVKVPSCWRLGHTAAGKKTWCTCMLYSDLELGTHPGKREMILSQVSRKFYLEMTINRKQRHTGKPGVCLGWPAVKVKESAFSFPQERWSASCHNTQSQITMANKIQAREDKLERARQSSCHWIMQVNQLISLQRAVVLTEGIKHHSKQTTATIVNVRRNDKHLFKKKELKGQIWKHSSGKRVSQLNRATEGAVSVG